MSLDSKYGLLALGQVVSGNSIVATIRQSMDLGISWKTLYIQQPETDSSTYPYSFIINQSVLQAVGGFYDEQNSRGKWMLLNVDLGI